MNAPWHHHSRIDPTTVALSGRYGLVLRGFLPTGTVAHVSDPNPVVLLAEKTREDVSMLDLCSAEIDLQDEFGFAVRILLRSELASSTGGRAILELARPL